MQSYTSSKFQKSYSRPATRIRVNWKTVTFRHKISIKTIVFPIADFSAKYKSKQAVRITSRTARKDECRSESGLIWIHHNDKKYTFYCIPSISKVSSPHGFSSCACTVRACYHLPIIKVPVLIVTVSTLLIFSIAILKEQSHHNRFARKWYQ